MHELSQEGDTGAKQQGLQGLVEQGPEQQQHFLRTR